MFNKVILIGRLVADPVIRHTQNGTPVSNMRIAVDRSFVNAQGKRETDFINIIAWNKLAETTGKHLKKGRLVNVEGRLQVRTYDDTEGTTRWVTEVVAEGIKFLDRAPKEEQEETADVQDIDLTSSVPF